MGSASSSDPITPRQARRDRVAPRWTLWPATIARVLAQAEALQTAGIKADRQGRGVSASSVAERALELGLEQLERDPGLFAAGKTR